VAGIAESGHPGARLKMDSGRRALMMEVALCVGGEMSNQLFPAFFMALLGATSCAALLLKGPVDPLDMIGAACGASVAVTFTVHAVRLLRPNSQR